MSAAADDIVVYIDLPEGVLSRIDAMAKLRGLDREEMVGVIVSSGLVAAERASGKEDAPPASCRRRTM